MLTYLKKIPINSSLVKLKKYLSEKHLEQNKCNLKNCFSCKEFDNSYAIKEAENDIKTERLEILIARKREDKAKRYQALYRRAGISENSGFNELLAD